MAASAALLVAGCAYDGDVGAPTSITGTSDQSTSISTSISTGRDSNGQLRPSPPPGYVALTALGVPLSDSGLRVLMAPLDEMVGVVLTGPGVASNAVEACVVAGSSDAPDDDACVRAPAGRAVDLTVPEAAGPEGDGTGGGVLIRRAKGSGNDTQHLAVATILYRPSGRAMTILTPPLARVGACSTGDCKMSLELAPAGSGTFELDADGLGGQPEITLRSIGDGGSSQVVSIVEGGGELVIRATVGADALASLDVRNKGEDRLPSLELSVVWPANP